MLEEKKAIAPLEIPVVVATARGAAAPATSSAVAHYIDTLGPAYAERTRQSMASDWRCFSAWFAENALSDHVETAESSADKKTAGKFAPPALSGRKVCPFTAPEGPNRQKVCPWAAAGPRMCANPRKLPYLVGKRQNSGLFGPRPAARSTESLPQ